MPDATDTDQAPPAHAARKREIIFAAAGFGLGFIALPIFIYIVGQLLLGAYAGGKGIGSFFVEFYWNLFHGAPRTWFIVFAPYLAIWLVRLSFRRYPFRQRGT